MPRFNPVPARLALCHTYFQNNPTAHSIKDLEKSLPANCGISGMQVKDYLSALVDDSKVRVEKIGSGNWYWCFRGDEKKLKEVEVRKWGAEEKAWQTKVDEVKEVLEVARKEREGDGRNDTSRENMIADFQRLTDEKAQLQKELAMYADSDPMEVERQHKLLKLYKEAINIYVDNVFSFESWWKRQGSAEIVQQCRDALGIEEDIDNV